MVKHQVRPGLTGWAQVNGYRGDTSIRKRIECDLYYIENWSVGFDIKIMFLTIFKGFINKKRILKRGKGKRMSKPRKKSKKILFILEIVVLLLFIGGLFVYGQISAKLDKIDIQETDLADQDIVTNDQAPQMTGYTTYALFGLDHRSKNEKLNTENSDTIIIASINNDTKAVKLVSVYRDTLLNVKDDTYSKANSAYALGGPTNAVSMLNTNLDLNITDYVAIDFNALVTVVDCLGGLDIPLSYAEIFI